MMETSFTSWSASIRGLVEANRRAALDGVVAYTAWFLWRERNSRIFENNYNPLGVVADSIRRATTDRALAFVRVVDDDLG